MMKAAHKFTASREEFIGLALSVWRGGDPDDLPLEGGIEVGKENEETQTNEVFTGVSGTAVVLLGSPLFLKGLYDFGSQGYRFEPCRLRHTSCL